MALKLFMARRITGHHAIISLSRWYKKIRQAIARREAGRS